jgi:alkylhydroperoxidase family enzyme
METVAHPTPAQNIRRPRTAVMANIPLDAASGKVRALYEDDLRMLGYVANSTKLFALRPELHAIWLRLIQAIRATVDPRRYELTALAVEAQLRCDTVSPGREVSRTELETLAHAHHYDDLSPAEYALMTFAARVALNAHALTALEAAPLREHGYSDPEILDIGLAASARALWSKALAAVGEEPDECYMTLDEGFRRAVRTARPVDVSAVTLTAALCPDPLRATRRSARGLLRRIRTWLSARAHGAHE